MVVLQGWCFELGFMPSNHYSGSDTSRSEMVSMGIMNGAREIQIVENGFHVRMVFLLLGLLLSIVNLPTASGLNDPPLPPIYKPPPIAVPPVPSARDQPPPLSPPPLVGFSPAASPPSPVGSPPPTAGPPTTTPPPPSGVGSSPAAGESLPSPASDPSPTPPPGIKQNEKTGGDTWNESEKAGVVIASIAALLQVAVVAFLLIKRHQMLTTVEYDDLEYDTPPDSNFRDIESA